MSWQTRRFTAILALVALPAVVQAEIDVEALFPAELVDFVPFENNPVFAAQGRGQWEVKHRERGWILREDGVYHMWFTGYDGERSGLKMLGYATSTDGLQWKRHSKNPIYDEHWVEDMMVVFHDGTYYMFAEGRDDQAHLLVSTDKTNWRRVGPLDIRHVDGRKIEPGPYGTPTAFREGGTWYLFYERRDAGIWLASSTDMKTWTHVIDDPVLVPGPGEHDKLLIALNQIVPYKGRYYAFFHGRGEGPDWSTHVAVSSDLINWIKYPKPILQDNKSSGILIPDGKGFRLYSMHDEVHVHFPAGSDR